MAHCRWPLGDYGNGGLSQDGRQLLADQIHRLGAVDLDVTGVARLRFLAVEADERCGLLMVTSRRLRTVVSSSSARITRSSPVTSSLPSTFGGLNTTW